MTISTGASLNYAFESNPAVKQCRTLLFSKLSLIFLPRLCFNMPHMLQALGLCIKFQILIVTLTQSLSGELFRCAFSFLCFFFILFFVLLLTLGRTSKLIPPPSYKGGGGGGWNPSPEFSLY